MSHIHAELMKQYAEDAAHYDEPWKFWEQFLNALWFDLDTNPTWGLHIKYRRKLTKPNPLKEKPTEGSRYYHIEIRVVEEDWLDLPCENRWLKEGNVFESVYAAKEAGKFVLSKLKES